MKKTLHLIMFCMLSLGIIKAKTQTNVSGAITSNTTWNLAGSPYYVTGNITVDSGVTLTIDSGVIVKFQGNFAINVEGILDAKGKSGYEVYFGGDSLAPQTHVKWKGLIATSPSAKINLYRSYLEDAETALDYSLVPSPGPSIYYTGYAEHCTFINNDCGIRAPKKDGNTYVYKSNFQNNQIGIDGRGMYVSNNPFGLEQNDSSGNKVFVIQSNFEYNRYGAINVSVQWGRFYKNFAAIITLSPQNIDSVEFIENSLGVGGRSANIGGCKFTMNDTAVRVAGSASASLHDSAFNVGGTYFNQNMQALNVEVNSQLGYVYCSWFVENGIAAVLPKYTFSRNHERSSIFENYFINNGVGVDFYPGYLNPGIPGFDSVLTKVRLNIFRADSGQFYVVNRYPQNVNMFFNSFIDSLQPIEDYLLDSSDADPDFYDYGYINYSTQVTALVNTPYPHYEMHGQVPVIKHNEYVSSDTLYTYQPLENHTYGMSDTIDIGCFVPLGGPLGLKPADVTKLAVTLYPNPAKDALYISLENKERMQSLSIYDINGREMVALNKDELVEKIMRIDIQNFAPGIYYIRVSGTQGTSSAKLVKE